MEMMNVLLKNDAWRKETVTGKFLSNSGYLVFGMLLLLWLFMPGFIRAYDQTAGGVDPAIWLLLVLGLLAFLLITGLSWWLLERFWLSMGLPHLGLMVLQFNSLALWQQLSFYWVSFALLLLVSSMCLIAIC